MLLMGVVRLEGVRLITMQAIFKTGKQYNADLSASYNIGARYWYSLIVGDKHFSRVFVGKSSNDTLRTPLAWGLSPRLVDTLRNLMVS
jgi:hypothetical protein